MDLSPSSWRSMSSQPAAKNSLLYVVIRLEALRVCKKFQGAMNLLSRSTGFDYTTRIIRHRFETIHNSKHAVYVWCCTRKVHSSNTTALEAGLEMLPVVSTIISFLSFSFRWEAIMLRRRAMMVVDSTRYIHCLWQLARREESLFAVSFFFLAGHGVIHRLASFFVHAWCFAGGGWTNN